MSETRADLSSSALAEALVAAAVLMKVAPDRIFEAEGRATRVLAGAALKAATGLSAIRLCKALRLASTERAPSQLARKGITSDMMMDVIEKIGGPAGAVALSQVLQATPEGVAAETIAESRPEVAKAPPPAPVVVQAAEPTRAASLAPVVQDRALKAPQPNLGVGRGRKRRSPVAAPAAERQAVARLKTITPKVARFAGWFARADWPVEEIADLFDVHPDALADALDYGVAA